MLSAALLGGCSFEVEEPPARPHIVLVMADDQGWRDTAYNGHPMIQTPDYDDVAASGLRFDRFYAAAPVCSPTRGSVMTGHFGKWHIGSVQKGSPVNPGASGFDEWLSAPNFFENDPILSREGKAIQTSGESSTVTVDVVIDFLRKHAGSGRPTFTGVWFGWYCSDNGGLPKVGSTGRRRHKVYQLEHDSLEQRDLAEPEPQRAQDLLSQLEQWQKSVTRSPNGDDYQ